MGPLRIHTISTQVSYLKLVDLSQHNGLRVGYTHIDSCVILLVEMVCHC